MSNETYGLSRYLEISKNKGAPRMMSVQNPYNLVNRTYEVGMSEISIREKCGLVYYPLALEDYLANKEMVKCLKIKNGTLQRLGETFKSFGYEGL